MAAIRSLGIGGSAIGSETIGGYTSSSVADPGPGDPGDPGGGTGAGITITINSVSASSFYAPGSLTINCDLGSRTTADFMLRDQSGSLSISTGSIVEIHVHGVLEFSGLVYSWDEEYPSYATSSNFKTMRIECTDFNQYADRHIISESYAGVSPESIVQDIIADHLAADGITAGTIDTSGITVEAVIFNFETVTSALDRLAELVGYSWVIDYEKKLHFRNKTLASSGVLINDSNIASQRIARIRTFETLDKYRNRQFIKAGRETTGERIDTFVGDGERQSFALQLPVSAEEKPRIFVDSVEVDADSIGVREIDIGMEWYYADDSNQITQDRDETALSSSQVLEVRYNGYYPILVQADDTAEQTTRAALEGGSGLYEAVLSDERITSADFAADRANAFLRKWANIAEQVEMASFKNVFPCGQTIELSLTKEGLSGDYLVESVSASDVGDSNTLRWSARLLDGEAFGGWPDFFKKLAEAGQKFSIAESSRPVVFRENAETVTLSDTMTGVEGSGAVLTAWDSDDYTVARVGVWRIANGTRVDESTGDLIENPRGTKIGSPTHV